jgi:hypothetical protein
MNALKYGLAVTAMGVGAGLAVAAMAQAPVDVQFWKIQQAKNRAVVTVYCKADTQPRELEGLVGDKDSTVKLVSNASGAGRIAITFVVPASWSFDVRVSKNGHEVHPSPQGPCFASAWSEPTNSQPTNPPTEFVDYNMVFCDRGCAGQGGIETEGGGDAVIPLTALTHDVVVGIPRIRCLDACQNKYFTYLSAMLYATIESSVGSGDDGATKLRLHFSGAGGTLVGPVQGRTRLLIRVPYAKLLHP